MVKVKVSDGGDANEKDVLPNGDTPGIFELLRPKMRSDHPSLNVGNEGDVTQEFWLAARFPRLISCTAAIRLRLESC
jgi:hypothetical protein